MDYNLIVLHLFNKQAKRLIKKYPSLRNELAELIAILKKDPKQGVPLGLNCFKIRLSISSKGKGKSGEGRVITHVHFSEDTVYLLNLYDKAEQGSVSIEAIKEQLKLIYNP
jgi:mRNA-degrading endonuclease RelE of RelBE toxin-antitoxin system